MQQQFINGKWTAALNGEVWKVLNPATEEVVAVVPFGDGADAHWAIQSAQAAFKTWKTVNAFDRAKLLKKTAELMREKAADYAHITSQESGKPYAEAFGEWTISADMFEWFAEEAKRTYGTVIPASRNNKRMSVIYQPIGVVGVISAWNFPIWNLARPWGAALAAGCSMVAKASEYTPLTAMLLVEILEEVGFPAGVVNLINGDAASMGDAMMDAPEVRKVHFVGSTRVGKILMDKASRTNTKLSLELGGNAPVLIFPDVNIAEIAPSIVAAKYRNCGQVCVSPQRFLVHQDIYEEFCRLTAELAKTYQVGPLINKKQQQQVENIVQAAVEAGATVLAGGQIPAGSDKGYFYSPTVLSNIDSQSPAFTNEIFGPVLPITSFKTLEEAIALANDTEYGLCAYVWTNDLKTATYASEALEFGMVGINEWFPYCTEAPFLGWKQSGQGSELGHDGIFEYMDKKLIAIGSL